MRKIAKSKDLKGDSYRCLLATAAGYCGCLLLLVFVLASSLTFAQRRRSGSHPSAAPREVLTNEDREMVETAMGAVCTERAKEDRGSLAIDDMQKRPSMPLQAPEVVRGAARAQRLLPVARDLVVSSLR